MRRLRAGAAAVALLAAACGAAPPPAAPTPTPPAGPRVTLPSGAVYSVEVAVTPEQRAQGLMFRESLRERAGMLFLFEEQPPIPHHFWMKNTMIPLDIVWMDRDGVVLFVHAHTPPCRADPCPTYGPDLPTPYVLELAGGLAAKEGVKPGARLKVEGIPSSALSSPPPSS